MTHKDPQQTGVGNTNAASEAAQPQPPEGGEQENGAAAPDSGPGREAAAAPHVEQQEQSTTVEEDDEDTYPLRDPSEDARWAVRIVWIWTGVAIFFIVFILAFLFLGLYYE